MVRELVENTEFVEVYMGTPLATCEKRDPKGLYQKARQGDIKDFTGIDSPYEAPENPEISLAFSGQTAEQSAEQLFELLKQ
jgi:adenylylsulfate kinase